MRWPLLLLFAVLLLSFGCIEEKTFEGTKSEQLAEAQEFDLDQDGIRDYRIYSFAPYTVQESGMEVKRMVTVTTRTTATYTSINPNLTDVDLLIADQSLEEFSQSRKQADNACSNKIGLAKVVCSDVQTCSRLCSSASLKCRNVAEAYEDELAGAMISYVQSNNEISSLTLDARRMVFDLRETTDEDRNSFLRKTRDIVASIADINTNPLYVHPEIDLCDASDFGVEHLTDAAEKIGNYRTEACGYHYRIMLSVKPTEPKDKSGLGVETGGVGLTDTLPVASVQNTQEISSIQKVVATESSGNVRLSWTSDQASGEGYLLVYEFESDTPPETLVASLENPDLKVRKIDLSGLIPVNMIFQLFWGITGNYYLAMGIALGTLLSALFLAYNIVIVLFTLASQKLAGASFTTGFRKAFGRTEVRWKSDIVIAAVFLALGIGVSIFLATPTLEPPELMESVGFLAQNGEGAVGIVLIMFGVLMAYLSAENLGKIILLEKVYGNVMKSEKQAFLAKADKLKERIRLLSQLVDEYSKENFDVGKEYDAYASLKGINIDSLTKDMTPRTKTLINEYLTKADRAINSLEEKKKLADENWEKWKETISKLLEEQEEVYVSSLVTIPASLRTWALARYAKEEGLLLERDAIKKIKVTPEKTVRELMGKGLIRGVIVIKNEKVVLSEFSDGKNTVVTALSLKLRSYLGSLAKNLGQHSPQSFVSVGQQIVLVLLRNKGMDSMLFVKREKFNEAVRQWKEKSKVFEGV
ncbi:hypothetical protein GF318_04595 [Candidatus Micrarchaeota archaeon]|nr:hypothetical protein [Candidatus Micrarchaeota archaeon]